MKNLVGIIALIIGLGMVSCSKSSDFSWKTDHSLVIENQDGEEIDLVQDLEAHAVNTNGFSANETARTIRGTYVTGSASSYIDGNAVGINIHLKYNFGYEGEEAEFTETMFHALWSEGVTHTLGKEGEGLFENSYLYLGWIAEDGSLTKYVTHVTKPDDEGLLEIISKEYVGKAESGRDVYQVQVRFQSSMINMNDDTDLVYVNHGIANLKVTDFSQEKTN